MQKEEKNFRLAITYPKILKYKGAFLMGHFQVYRFITGAVGHIGNNELEHFIGGAHAAFPF